jgi:hypothetical protein
MSRGRRVEAVWLGRGDGWMGETDGLLRTSGGQGLGLEVRWPSWCFGESQVASSRQRFVYQLIIRLVNFELDWAFRCGARRRISRSRIYKPNKYVTGVSNELYILADRQQFLRFYQLLLQISLFRWINPPNCLHPWIDSLIPLWARKSSMSVSATYTICPCARLGSTTTLIQKFVGLSSVFI